MSSKEEMDKHYGGVNAKDIKYLEKKIIFYRVNNIVNEING